MKLSKLITYILLILVSSYSLKSQWVVEDTPTNSSPYYISIVDTGTIWGLGYTTGWWGDVRLFHKMPIGWWGLWNYESDLPGGIQYLCIAGLDSNTAFVGDINGHIYKTTNYGWNWVNIINAGQNYMVVDIKFSRINRNSGYIFCVRNDYGNTYFKIYKTTNYGNNWQLFTPYFGYFGFANKPSVWVTDSSHAWIGLWCLSSNCPYLKIAYTSDGGLNWLTSNVETNRRGVEAITFSYDNTFGIVISHLLNFPKNRLYSTNGGLNWYNVDTIKQGNVLSLITIPETSVWYMNGVAYYLDSPDEPYVYKSSNNGINWLRMTIPDTSEYFADMDAVKVGNKIYAWATGFGRILRCVDTAVSISINNNNGSIPIDYELQQNYPNPFNPKTIIRYLIPKSGAVTIKVYNAQGKEIAVLLNNEYKTPGIYDIEFEATNLPSGVYFYRIEARQAGSLTGTYIEAKKMVLIK